MDQSTAEKLAERVRRLVAPACAEVMVVGSVRRRRPEVKDIELACIPGAAAPIFGEPKSAHNLLEALLVRLVRDGELWRCPDPSRRLDGKRQKRFWLPEGIEVELWIADVSAANFGNTVAIRTGSADFSRLLVTERRSRGLLPDGWMEEGGYLWPFRLEGKERERLTRRNAPAPPLVCRTEADFFGHLGIGPGDIPPPETRDEACARRLRALVMREGVGA